jgi:DNA-binding NtrC family response regulator
VQEKTFVAVGDQRVRKVDVRLVLATNRNLPDEVAQGRFRADLYYRINVFTLNLPALNERGDDPLLMARHFVQKFACQYNKDITDFSNASLDKLGDYHWPGNVRELRNCMMRAVILCSGAYIEPEHLILQEQSDDNVVPIKPNVASIASTNTNDVSEPQSEELVQIAELLAEVVALAKQQTKVLSVSNWLEKQWLNQCVLKWGSLYQVAQQLGQSESTIRRRYAKLNKQDFSHDELFPLTERCNQLLVSMLDTETHSVLWPSIEATLHQIVIQQDVSQQHKAKLLDVTQPTLRKIIQQSQG